MKEERVQCEKGEGAYQKKNDVISSIRTCTIEFRKKKTQEGKTKMGRNLVLLALLEVVGPVDRVQHCVQVMYLSLEVRRSYCPA